VKVGNLSNGNATPATVKVPVEHVQTGGFGDPSGLKGKAIRNKGNIVVRQGLPSLPADLVTETVLAATRAIVGPWQAALRNSTAVPPQGGKKGNIQAGGFGDQRLRWKRQRKKAVDAGPADTPVTILDKPKPEYTADGR